jgi:hypothetical protein
VAKPSQVQDPALRGLVEEARSAYLDNNNRESIEKSVAAFMELLRRQPDFLTAGPFAKNDRRVWPPLGVALAVQPGEPPEAVYQRDRYSNPDAITYYEYVLDSIVAAAL